MTTIDFFKKKNEILRETLGLNFDLVPSYQMINIPFKELSIDRPSTSCPYCLEYNNEDTDVEELCSKCPMFLANNSCLEDEDSTWERYVKSISPDEDISSLHTEPTSPAYEQMVKLIEEYNKSNQGDLDEI